jgi:hypothetical protein
MKNLKKMNVNRIVLLLVLTHSIFSFSQKKGDVYFVLKDTDKDYFIAGNFEVNRDYITIYNREEYEYHQKKVEEAKKKDAYEFDPESGRDNLNIKVSKLIFEVISREKIEITECEIKSQNLVDYNWILNNSWKKIAKQPYDFKDIYFLYQIDKNEYLSYKVGVTVVSH